MQILFMKEIENTVVNSAIIAQAENIIFYNMWQLFMKELNIIVTSVTIGHLE